MSRVSAAAISIATKSSGSSSRRLPLSSFTPSQLGPITTRMTSHSATWPFQVRHEVGPHRNVVDIHKELGAAESVREPIMQPTGHTDGIISAVVDENLADHGYRVSPKDPKFYCRTGQTAMSLFTLRKFETLAAGPHFSQG
jgi:hypothetical protein